ncbi:hypothetical protein GCM10010345_19340 [Streptomyces canarius]|uniref:non-reducing end alpha-L-arabinofuranosidase n=1 Tax=Streptomyces canarius TaxID=285453 RepID=A0ABQ3CH66_9ACTN|nr:hypothetical protein GCM10010345_19340 [Streptomyces canarius]
MLTALGGTAATTRTSAAALPSSFGWSSSGQPIAPKPDATPNIAGIKDPSVVYCNGKYRLSASVASSSGHNLVHQMGNASCFTNPDISDPNGWSAPRDFYASTSRTRAVTTTVRRGGSAGSPATNFTCCDRGPATAVRHWSGRPGGSAGSAQWGPVR